MVLFYEKKIGPTNDVILISFEKYSQNFHFFFFFFPKLFSEVFIWLKRNELFAFELKNISKFYFYEEKSLSNLVFKIFILLWT